MNKTFKRKSGARTHTHYVDLYEPARPHGADKLPGLHGCHGTYGPNCLHGDHAHMGPMRSRRPMGSFAHGPGPSRWRGPLLLKGGNLCDTKFLVKTTSCDSKIDTFFPQPRLPEGVLAVSEKGSLQVVRPSWDIIPKRGKPVPHGPYMYLLQIP